MKYRILTKIACKLMALYFFILSLNFIPNMIISFIFNHSDMYYMQSIIPWLLNGTMTILAAVLLWIFADKISTIIVKDIPESVDKNELNINIITTIAFTLVGLIVLTNAIPDTVRMIFQHYLNLASQLNFKETGMYADSLARIAGEAVQVGLGIWLLLGSKGIFSVIKGLRNIGLDRIESKEE
jgi:hypothetical protein